MARRGSGGRSSSRPAHRGAPPSAPVRRQAPPPANVQNGSGGSILGSIGTTIADGFAFGSGSAMAHRAVDYFLGPRTIEVEEKTSVVPKSVVPNSDACSMQTKAFQDCVNYFGSDISQCQTYMDMLSQCKNNSHQSSGMGGGIHLRNK